MLLKTIEIKKANFVEAIYLQTFKGLLGYELIDPYPFFPKPKTKRRKDVHAFQELVDLEGHSFESITKLIDIFMKIKQLVNSPFELTKFKARSSRCS
jgi:hypothetical protein